MGNNRPGLQKRPSLRRPVSTPGSAAGLGISVASPSTQEDSRMTPSILEPMPAPVEEKVEQLLDEGEQPRVSACTDMDAEGHFRGAWLVATERRLLIVAPETDDEAARRPASARPRRRPQTRERLSGDRPGRS